VVNRIAPELEIREPAGAFERIEAHLRDDGFFVDEGRDAVGRCADVYLGYGLAAPRLRRSHPPSPEPIDLPLAACRIRDVDERPGRTPTRDRDGYRLGTWEPTWSTTEYARAVQAAREAIAAGEVYQVNLVQHLSAPFEGDPGSVAEALRSFGPLHGRPFVGDGWTVVSASPELFLSRHGQRIWTKPIKGTRPRGGSEELRRSAKDAAEHVMIVDLERNDLGQVCVPGSIGWPELMVPRPMAGVEHLVSQVEGVLREDVTLATVLAAMFPGGSVTGAPKVAALDHIEALEPVGRGASMGALGTVWPDGRFELALTIRTFAIGDDRIHLWVGGGVVWDSDPMAEVEESWVKARPLLHALAAGSVGALVHARPGRQGRPGLAA
jgi:para-aminobenzoate synthetase component 1